MATIQAALIAALRGAAGVSALVGTRVFIAGGRQGTAYPYVTVQKITTAGAARLDGASSLDWPLFQINAWSPDANEAEGVATAIRAAIDCVATTASGRTFTATFQDERGPTADEETRNFNVSQDFLLFHERT